MSQPHSEAGSNKSALVAFGAQLRIHRERGGLTQERLGEKIKYAGGYIGNVERGERQCERELAVAADVALNTHGALVHLWDELLKGGAYPAWFDWPVYEGKAIALRGFELSVVPGLLQTPEYAHVLLPKDKAEARLTRQSILTREAPSPPLLVAVLDESVLLRQVGSREVMHDQLKHLASVVSGRVSVHVARLVDHMGISGSFTIATLDDRKEIAYLDTGARGLTMSDPKDITTLTENFEMIRNRALPVDQSIDLITRTAEDRWT
jgi:transcriptional regulator with XRE-family HTH domain